MIFKSRMIGKQQVLRMFVENRIKRGEDCLIMCNNYPKDICSYLEKENVGFICAPNYVTPNISPIYSYEGIVGWEQKEKYISGYIFKPKVNVKTAKSAQK